MSNLDLNKIKDFLNKDISSSKIDSRIMSLFLKQLSLLVNAGLSLDKSLKIIEEQKLDKKLSLALDKVNKDLSRGMSIDAAFDKNQKYFDPMVIAFIKSAGKSGFMGKVLDQLSSYISEETKNKKIIQQSLTYPLLILVVMIILVILVLAFVLPTFVSIFESFGTDLPLATQILIAISKFFKNYGIFILLLIGIFVISLLILRKDEKILYIIDKFIFLRLPFFKYRRLGLEYQFASLLYILKAGDIDIITSLNIIRESFKNTYIKEVLNNIIIDLNKGYSLGLSLSNKNIFSPLLISMVKIGEDSGDMAAALKKSSDYLSNDYLYKLGHISTIAEPVMIIIMSILVAFVVFAIALPIFESVNAVGF